MKRLIFLICILFCAAEAFAAISLEPLLNKISLQLTAEKWVTTSSALVTVSINAALADKNIANMQNEVLQKLNQLASSNDWHIVSFNREQAQSGLESIQISAEARLPQASLANLRDKAKAISKPGETFTIDSVQFVPSEEEVKQANNNLRNNIYQQISEEITAINKIYTDQKFYLHSVDFMFNRPIPMAQNMLMKVAGSVDAHAAPATAPPPLAVGNKVEINARVVLAAMPAQLTQKLQ